MFPFLLEFWIHRFPCFFVISTSFLWVRYANKIFIFLPLKEKIFFIYFFIHIEQWFFLHVINVNYPPCPLNKKYIYFLILLQMILFYWRKSHLLFLVFCATRRKNSFLNFSFKESFIFIVVNLFSVFNILI